MNDAARMELTRIVELAQARRFGDARGAAEALLARLPDNRDALYFLAFSQRQLGLIPDALNTLGRLEKTHPEFSRLHEERGHCHVALRDARRAIEAFRAAVTRNPALPVSWSMLVNLYRMVGDRVNEAAAAAQVQRWKEKPPEVVQATSLFADGEGATAEDLLRGFLRRFPGNVEAMHVLAVIAFGRRALEEAEGLLAAVLKRTPGDLSARHSHALVLLERHRFQEAHAEAQTLITAEPGNLQFQALSAQTCVGLGLYAQAIPIYRQLLAATPGSAELHLSLGHALRALGSRDEAIAAYRAAAAARPSYGDAYWSLANLKTYQFAAAEILRMQALESTPGLANVDRYNLCFALGKALEDQGDYPLSWRYYERGNALKRSESHYRADIVETNTRLQIEVCTREFLAARGGYGDGDRAPILIVGMPRAGSTLLEQILASHSLVEGTHELTSVQEIVRGLQGAGIDLDNPRYPGVLATLTGEDFRQLGQRYLRDAQPFRRGRPYFIDKMPNNFRHIGLIHLMLPNAKIIDARRDPLACCFSNFKQLFGNGQEFTYSIEDIARYYRTYVRLMRHWDEVLPGRILRINHEDVVDDLEGNVRRMLDFCGLEFEPACLEFHRTGRVVQTASADQVRQPIFREGLDQWKHYAQWLGPLRAALGDCVETA